MSRLINAVVLVALFAAHNVWAACASDIDMEGNRVLNVAVTGSDVSEAATVAYLQKVMDERSQGNMLSGRAQQDMTWAEALSFCANLVSAAADNPVSPVESPGRVYSDWRLPALEEWLAACRAQGSELKLDFAGKDAASYKASRTHPARTWLPKGVCKNDDEKTFWWVNRHSTETKEGEDLLFHGLEATDIRDPKTEKIDLLHHVYAPEQAGLVKNVAYGYPEAWNSTSSEIQKIRGDQKLAVRCVR